MAKRAILVSLALVLPLLVAAPASAVGETCDGRPATQVGTAGNDVLIGTSGDDVMVGLDGDDLIHGLLGNDTLCGDAGSDTVVGREGNDRLFGGLDGAVGGDVLWPGSGDDYIDAGWDPVRMEYDGIPVDTLAYSDLALPAGTGVRVDLTAGTTVKPAGTDQIVVSGVLAVLATPGPDVLIGSPNPDVLVGRGGVDLIQGGAGPDNLIAATSSGSSIVIPPGDGADVVDGGPGDDHMDTGLGGGTARGGEGNDSITVRRASAMISVSGGAGEDFIDARAVSNLVIDAGPDADVIRFSLSPSAGHVEVDGGGGHDSGSIRPDQGAFRRGSSITLDQARGLVRTDETIGAVRGLEELGIRGVELHWTYRGTDAAEHVVLRGARSLDARTRGGRDVVAGTSGRDVLDLGQGRDYAIGRRGRDVCIGAEEADGCEVRR